MMKKADLSINVIVVAVIAVLVLVLMVLILTGKIDWFHKTTTSCQNLKGECMPLETCQAKEGSSLQKLDCADGLICCQLPAS